MTLAAVCLTEDARGTRFAYALHGERYGQDTVHKMTTSDRGVVGRMEEIIYGSCFARACVLDDVGSFTADAFARHGTVLAEAWCAAFSDHVGAVPEVRTVPRESVTVVNVDKGEFLTERTFRPSLLPMLLFIGPEYMCPSPDAGRWAFDRLAVCRRAPSEREGLKDVSEVVEWP